jgi:hypothetical protein
MKNTLKLIGIIALVAVMGFSMLACDNSGGGGTSGNNQNNNNNNNNQDEGGTLTLTNFAGDLTEGKYVFGMAFNEDTELELFFVASMDVDAETITGVSITGSSITLNVFVGDYDQDKLVPFTGNAVIPAFDLEDEEHGLIIFELDEATNPFDVLVELEEFEKIFLNTASITFTSGNATINFSTQMELLEF